MNVCSRTVLLLYVLVLTSGIAIPDANGQTQVEPEIALKMLWPAR